MSVVENIMLGVPKAAASGWSTGGTVEAEVRPIAERVGIGRG